MFCFVLFYCGFCFYFSSMNKPAQCMCVRIRIVVIQFFRFVFFSRFVLFPFKKKNCGCHATLVLRLVYFIFHNEGMRLHAAHTLFLPSSSLQCVVLFVYLLQKRTV